MRTGALYVTQQTAHDCATAAQLEGVSCGDEWAERVLRRELATIPEIAELQGKIAYAIKSTREKYMQGRQAAPSPAQQAAAAISDAKH